MHHREKMASLGSKVTWASRETGWEHTQITSLSIIFSQLFSSLLSSGDKLPFYSYSWLKGDNGSPGARGEDGPEGLKGQAGLMGDIGASGTAGEKVHF